MLNSEIVGLSLPRLRRYARALTGSQASGDAYVATTLEALSEDAAVLQEADNPVVALYRAFSKIWNSIDQKMDVKPLPDDEIVRFCLRGAKLL